MIYTKKIADTKHTAKMPPLVLIFIVVSLKQVLPTFHNSHQLFPTFPYWKFFELKFLTFSGYQNRVETL